MGEIHFSARARTFRILPRAVKIVSFGVLSLKERYFYKLFFNAVGECAFWNHLRKRNWG